MTPHKEMITVRTRSLHKSTPISAPNNNEPRNHRPAEQMKGISKVVTFDGPPEPEQIKPGEAGVNLSWLTELADNPPPKNKHWPSMLRELVLNPRADGTTPTNDEMAAKLGVFRDTVMRAKKRWQKIGVIYRVNYNGVYAYNPKMLVAKDKDGNVIKHVSIDVRAASDMEAYH